jgi:hypothetical protein
MARAISWVIVPSSTLKGVTALHTWAVETVLVITDNKLVADIEFTLVASIGLIGGRLAMWRSERIIEQRGRVAVIIVDIDVRMERRRSL